MNFFRKKSGAVKKFLTLGTPLILLTFIALPHEVFADVPPIITSISPTQGAVGSTVTIHGTNLSGVTYVVFNVSAGGHFVGWIEGTSLGTITPTSVSFTVPASIFGDPLSPGTYHLTVADSNGTYSTYSSGVDFTVGNSSQTQTPTITAISPTQGAGVGTSVTLSGTNLSGTTGVDFYTSAGQYFGSVGYLGAITPTSVNFIVPASLSNLSTLTSGTYQVKVTAAGGVSSNSVNFTYGDAPPTPSPTTPPTTQSGGFVPLAPLPGLTSGDGANSIISSGSFGAFFNHLYDYLIGIAVIIAIIMVIWGGLQYSTQDSISKKGEGKERIQQAIFGLILVLSPALVFTIINPAILNFSLSFTPIEQGAPLATPPGSVGTVDPTTGCTSFGVAGVFQKAVCPTSEAVTAWVGANCISGARLVDGGAAGSNSGGSVGITVYCSYESQEMILIDIGVGAGNYIFSPLAAQPDTVAEFQRFVPTCQSSGGVVCGATILGTGPGLWDAHECSNYGGYTTVIPGTTNTERCYEEALTCDPPDHPVGNDYCPLTVNPTPFQ